MFENGLIERVNAQFRPVRILEISLFVIFIPLDQDSTGRNLFVAGLGLKTQTGTINQKSSRHHLVAQARVEQAGLNTWTGCVQVVPS